MSEISSSKPFSVSVHRSKEIRESVKQTLNNIMKKIEEYSSLAVLCKEVSIEFCNNKIQFRYILFFYIISYIDSSSNNNLSKSSLFLQHQSEKVC